MRGYVLVGENAQAAAYQVSQLAGIYKQDLVFAFAVGAVFAVAVAAQDKQTRRDAGSQEQLVGHLHNAIYHAVPDHVFAHVLFAGAARGHGAIGHYYPGGAAFVEVMPQRLEPHIVGVAGGGKAVFGAE